ncbi:HAMP domain-containing histidine kinase [Paenibacillus sp. sptzw28]|uniref:sensor histidine kinase n=1 Tax=Paenibacillus sp. sptzw28 TaxID=715179 RepID=UPI001C6E6801|nr:ATP-binding protein [Paenibacillus sp. sptzw28]QYR22794.1 HAMP domain-containing histidine kinase [Paenibacillus sp. sptzw28]
MMRKWKKSVKRWFMPRSLRYQLLTRSLFILAALFILIGLMQSWLMRDFLYRNQANSLESQLMSMPKQLFGDPHPERHSFKSRPGPKDDGAPGEPEKPTLFLSDTSLAIIGFDGSFTDISGGQSGTPSPRLTEPEYTEIKNELLKHVHVNYKLVQDPTGMEQLVVYSLVGPPNNPEGLSQMGAATSPLKQVMMQQLVIFACLSVLALGGGMALYMPVLRRTLIPLSRIVRAVEQTDSGNLTERLPDHQGQEEIDRLSVSFNGMLERLDTSFEAERMANERMRRFIADASHELRTPLTSIHGFLEVLLRGAATNSEQLYGALNSMHSESRRINKLVEDLLLLSKLDQAPQLRLTEGGLDHLIREMEPQLQVLAGNRSVRFHLAENVRGKFDLDKIKQVLLNLFHNAVQHTDPERGVITVSLEIAKGKAELTVRDNGPGIGKEHLPKVFERFYRSDSSRTRKYGGAGLGLSISKSIIEAHDGSIDVESTPGEGTAFRCTLPILSYGRSETSS